MSTLGPAELDDRRGDGDVVVLDVRPTAAFRSGHIEGSINVPVYDRLRQGEGAALAAYLDEIPADAEVVTVCKAGLVAQEATRYLQERGYDARTLLGGYTGWRHYDNHSVVYRGLSLLRRMLPERTT